MSDYANFSDAHVKHLEMIQAVVSRLGTDSFLVKGWAVTVSGAFLGFAIDGEEWGLALAGALPAVIFWCLDAYFLRTERRFRALYEAVRTGTPTVAPFSMDPAISSLLATSGRKSSWLGALFSLTLVTFYGALVVAAAVLSAILCH
jgi:hypothetical protein